MLAPPAVIHSRHTVKASYFLGNRLLGTSTFESANCLPHSEALFCKTCGDIWGRIYVEGSDWDVRAVPCSLHTPLGVSDWSAVPGSFLRSEISVYQMSVMFRAAALEHLPMPVLAREIAIFQAQAKTE
jgi:hypothetical protein